MKSIGRRGLFGPLIVLVLLFMLVWIWVIILPDVTPIIGDTIEHTQASTVDHKDGVEFFLRMIPWAVPAIIILGFLWLMVKG